MINNEKIKKMETVLEELNCLTGDIPKLMIQWKDLGLSQFIDKLSFYINDESAAILEQAMRDNNAPPRALAKIIEEIQSNKFTEPKLFFTHERNTMNFFTNDRPEKFSELDFEEVKEYCDSLSKVQAAGFYQSLIDDANKNRQTGEFADFDGDDRKLLAKLSFQRDELLKRMTSEEVNEYKSKLK